MIEGLPLGRKGRNFKEKSVEESDGKPTTLLKNGTKTGGPFMHASVSK